MTTTPGTLVPGEGIYLGEYAPKTRDGKTLGLVFNVYAAPEDLTNAQDCKGTFTYPELLTRMGEITDWHGFDGLRCAGDIALIEAIENGSYQGQWIVPPREIAIGRDIDGNEAPGCNMHACKNSGAFKNTFLTAAADGGGSPDWYWTCTGDREQVDAKWAVNFAERPYPHDNRSSVLTRFRKSCRPVRLVRK